MDTAHGNFDKLYACKYNVFKISWSKRRNLKWSINWSWSRALFQSHQLPSREEEISSALLSIFVFDSLVILDLKEQTALSSWRCHVNVAYPGDFERLGDVQRHCWLQDKSCGGRWPSIKAVADSPAATSGEPQLRWMEPEHANSSSQRNLVFKYLRKS